MNVARGTMLGPYRIEESIGAGGMGEVFRARDTRLDRDVAVKVIPPGPASNPQLLARFEREAKVVSSLSHPHICVLHDVGEQSDGDHSVHFFVMELVRGETLDDRIRRGAIPTYEAIAIGIQIARALEHAHARGVIHRDLKPSNIMLTSSGVKLLDFGLSKMLRESGEDAVDEAGATVHRGITEEGVVLGTFQYMAPEQAEGKEADARTDVFALGAILYEMVTGRRAFEGTSRASLIAAIMAIDPPDVTALRPEAPPALERVIRSCLEKNPEDRWQVAHDVRLALELASAARGAEHFVPERRAWRGALPWTVAALAVMVALVAFLSRRPSQERDHFAFEIVPGKMRYAWAEGPVRVSPDGKRLLVSMFDPEAQAEGGTLYVRDLDSLEFRKLGPVGFIFEASWSWDGDQILFFQDFKLKTIPSRGGPVTTLAKVGDSRGASWGPDGTILYVPEWTGGVYATSSSGGKPRRVTSVDRSKGEVSHVSPLALPDGEHFLFLLHSENASARGIYVGSLDGSPPRFLTSSTSAPVFAEPDRLLYWADGNLYVQRLDMSRLVPLGTPDLVAEKVAYNPEFDNPGYSASRNGVLAFHRSSEAADSPIHEYNLGGDRVELHPMAGDNLDLSRDSTKLAVQLQSDRGRAPDLWVWDLERGIKTRLTSDDAPDIGPVWSPDGQWIAYSNPGNPTRIYRKRSNGLGEQELLLEREKYAEPVDWSADGRWILVESFSEELLTDLIVIDLEAKPPTAKPVLATRFDEESGRFSPDARWISYAADDSGRQEIFVQPFPPDGRRWQVSLDGGSDARWNGDATVIYWMSRGAVMAADVDASTDFRVRNIRRLFDAPSTDWDVASSGAKFFIADDSIAASTPIIVSTDW